MAARATHRVRCYCVIKAFSEALRSIWQFGVRETGAKFSFIQILIKARGAVR